MRSMAQLATQGKEEATRKLQEAVSRTVEKLLLVQHSLHSRLPVWGRNLLAEKQGFVHILQEVLSGLVKAAVKTED